MLICKVDSEVLWKRGEYSISDEDPVISFKPHSFDFGEPTITPIEMLICKVWNNVGILKYIDVCQNCDEIRAAFTCNYYSSSIKIVPTCSIHYQTIWP